MAQPPAALRAPKGETRIEEPTRTQRLIGRRTAEARATVPDLELSVEVEMDACAALIGRLSVTALLVRASALALRDYPRANSAYRDGRFELYSRVNVGVGIATDDAYVVPTVFDADGKSIEQIQRELDELSPRARAGELEPPELTGATFTVCDLGPFGVHSSTTVLSPPQAAALAAGAIRAVPVVRDTAIVPGAMMTLTLGCDQRILPGPQAAPLLAGIRSRLEAAAL